MFHHIYGQLQGKFSFGKFCQKVGIRSDPPPGWSKRLTFPIFKFLRLPLSGEKKLSSKKKVIQWEKVIFYFFCNIFIISLPFENYRAYVNVQQEENLYLLYHPFKILNIKWYAILTQPSKFSAALHGFHLNAAKWKIATTILIPLEERRKGVTFILTSNIGFSERGLQTDKSCEHHNKINFEFQKLDWPKQTVRNK